MNKYKNCSKKFNKWNSSYLIYKMIFLINKIKFHQFRKTITKFYTNMIKEKKKLKI